MAPHIRGRLRCMRFHPASFGLPTPDLFDRSFVNPLLSENCKGGAHKPERLVQIEGQRNT